jgi:hypothetical protein
MSCYGDLASVKEQINDANGRHSVWRPRRVHRPPATNILETCIDMSTSLYPSIPAVPSLRELSQPLLQMSKEHQKKFASLTQTKKTKAIKKRPLTADELSRRRHIRYGVGCCSGVALVLVVKKVLRSLPFIGPILSPALSLVPSVLTGVIIGSAVVYGIEEGDLSAGPRRVRQEARRIGREIEGTVSDVHSDIRRISRRHEEEVARLASSVEDTLSQEVAPSILRAGRSLVRQMEDGLLDLQDEIKRGSKKIEQSLRRS